MFSLSFLQCFLFRAGFLIRDAKLLKWLTILVLIYGSETFTYGKPDIVKKVDAFGFAIGNFVFKSNVFKSDFNAFFKTRLSITIVLQLHPSARIDKYDKNGLLYSELQRTAPLVGELQGPQSFFMV